MSELVYRDRYLDLLKSTLCASLYDESAWRTVDGPMAQNVSGPRARLVAGAKHALLGFLRRRDMSLVCRDRFDAETRRQGLDWPLFGFTMTGRARLDALHRLVDDVLAKNVPGDFAETGVWRGGSSILVRALFAANGVTDRCVWCADSFAGMPVPTVYGKAPYEDFSDREYLAVSVDQVKRNFERFGLLDDQVRFLQGWFRDTLPSAPIERLAVLRLDGDLYESTQDALVGLYDRVSPGGYVIIDDYYCWPGCKLAADEFRASRGIADPIVRIDAQAGYWQRAA